MSTSTDASPQTLILQACHALFAPGQVVELRVLGIPSNHGKPKNAAGWFNDLGALAEVAANTELHRTPEGIYVTLNPVHTGCLARSPNKAKDYAQPTTSDRDILSRQWLYIDLDPVRPSGVSSCQAELDACRETARAVATWLESEFGFPAGVRAFSGNGIHLLYRVALANDDPGKATIAECLKAIDGKHSSAAVKVDLSNVNAARIIKLYGTIARKGEATEDRPHRRSHLFTVGGVIPTFESVQIVPAEALEKLAALGRTSSPSSAGGSSGKRKASKGGAGNHKPTIKITPTPIDGEYAVDLESFIVEHSIGVSRREPYDGTGLRYVLDHCVFDPTHEGTSASLGRSSSGRIWYRCFHDSCTDRDWKAVKALFSASGDGRGQSKDVKPSNKDASGGASGDANPWTLARDMVADVYTDIDTGQVQARRHREIWYVYDRPRRCYVEVPDDSIKVEVTRYLSDCLDKVTRKTTWDVIDCLGAILTAPHDIELPFLSRIDPDTQCSTGDPRRRNWITLSNGILDIDAIVDGANIEDCLHCHTPEWFNRTALPFPFPVRTEQIECPAWSNFLAETFRNKETGETDQSRIDLLQEAFGYCFATNLRLEAFFVFHGPAGSGKSTALNVLQSLLGRANVTSHNMEQLVRDEFLADLQGKLANVCSDMNEMEKVQEGVLKAIVSEDLITARRIYKSPMQFRPKCRLFFATNVLPRFTDTSLGIWRRMQLIPFETVVAPEDMDIFLPNALEAELPGIFWWTLQGLIRLRQNQAFTASPRCIDAAREFRVNCFPVLMFLEECTEPGGKTLAGDLWKVYKAWCNSVGLQKPKALHAFAKDVAGFMPGVRLTYIKGQLRNYSEMTGVSVKPCLALGEHPNTTQQEIGNWVS